MNKVDEAKKMALDMLGNALPETLFSTPLEYIHADHLRQRVLCGVLDGLAESQQMDLDLLKVALSYLKGDFQDHLSDEEEDLFPLLQKRAEPDDDIDGLIERLCKEHSADRIDARYIMDKLEHAIALNNSESISEGFIDNVHRFTANERHHLIVENAIVMPLAQIRLFNTDLVAMKLNMAKRRGIQFAHANEITQTQ